MQTNPILKKGFAVGIIILFGMNIAPLASGSLVEKDIVKEKLNPGSLLDLQGFNFTITGTMGENGWYVSNVIITFTADNGSGGMPIYYKLHAEDPWIEIPWCPITISTDGFYELWVACVDSVGQWHVYGPYPFKIDKTAPVTLNFTATPENLWKTKWLLRANVTDATSGIDKVDFYVDDDFIGNVSAPGPYVIHYIGKGKLAQAIPYDNAGNTCMSSGPPDVLKIQLFHNFFYSLILRFQMIVQWLLYLVNGE
jgi:hypothetical protein